MRQLLELAEAARPDFPGMDKKMMDIGKKNGVDFKDADAEQVKKAIRDAYSIGYADGYNSAPKGK